jgi:hypothetical protein
VSEVHAVKRLRYWLIRRLGGVAVGPNDSAIFFLEKDDGTALVQHRLPPAQTKLNLATSGDSPLFWGLALVFLFGDSPKAANRRKSLRVWVVRELVRAQGKKP